MDKKEDLYANYNDKRYAHFREIDTGEHEWQKVKSAVKGERRKSIKKKVKVSFEEVKEMKLDKLGHVAPTLDTEDFTMISNYLFDFWGAIMGDSAVTAYLHLKRYAYGKKDYCYVDTDIIGLKMDKGKTALRGYLNTLEDYGFIVQFRRYNIEDNNRESTPLFKIRRYIPLLTEEIYHSLAPKLKDLHDNFMSSYEDITFNTKIYKADEFIDDIVNNGEIINNKQVQEKIEQTLADGRIAEYILNSMSPTQRAVNDDFQDYMLGTIAKASYETWIRHSILIKVDELRFDIIAPNQFAQNHLQRNYLELVRKFLLEELDIDYAFSEISFAISDDYIQKIMSRVI